LPRGQDPDRVSMEDALELLEKKKAAGPALPPRGAAPRKAKSAKRSASPKRPGTTGAKGAATRPASGKTSGKKSAKRSKPRSKAR
ncbi:MAG: hypothetical protein JXA90_15905, partial [Planctomycetes bacterium]|nr:hypothetical protein [Planctomycetota bacterium]